MNLFKRKSCPFCESIEFVSLYKKKYTDQILVDFLSNYYKGRFPLKTLNEKYYEIQKCNHCEGLFQLYIPDEFLSKSLYNDIISHEESFAKQKKNENIENKKYTRIAKLIESLFSKENKKIKILDFGAGWGQWTNFMRSMEFNVETFEISKPKIEFLKNNNIKNYSSIEELKTEFDLIYSEEVLEHLNSPKTVINEISRHLKLNGYMIHFFPSTFMFKYRLKFNYRPRKDCAHPLEHINLLNKNSFKKMIEGTGLNILRYNYNKNLNFLDNIKMFKNSFLFNQVILKKIIK